MQFKFRMRVSVILWILLQQFLTLSYAGDSHLLLLNPTNGDVYFPANPTSSNTYQSTPTISGTTQGVGNSTKSIKALSSLSSATDSTKPIQISSSLLSPTDNAKPAQIPSSLSSATNNTKPVQISSSLSSATDSAKPAQLLNNLSSATDNAKPAQILSSSSSATSIAKPAQVLSALSSATGTGARASIDGDSTRSTASSITTRASSITNTASETWPASVIFVSQSGSVTVVDIGFLTTSDGTTYVTNTQPQQSLISATGSGLGLVVITESGTVTTLSLSSLPTATSLSPATGVQVVTQSGTVVTYSPYYLAGYTNAKPIEIYATFGENVNGKITSQAGWWLIGPDGKVDPPEKGPWPQGGGHIGCLLGPLFCHTGWIEVGGGLIVLGLIGLGPPGPPGYPGGPINGMNGEPDDDPPPNDDGDSDPKTQNQQSKNQQTEDQQTEDQQTTTLRSISSIAQSSFTSSASSEGTAQYYIVLEAGADQVPVDQALKEVLPGTESVQPDLAGNIVDGGFYIGYNLTSDEAHNISSLSEVWVINTYTSGLYSFSDPAPSTTFTTTAVLATYTGGPAYASSTGTTPAKIRRKARREVSRLDPQSSRSNNLQVKSDELDGRETLNKTSNLQKRDRGRDMVWQVNSPKDLSVLAWYPGKDFDHVDYVMEETKGKQTVSIHYSSFLRVLGGRRPFPPSETSLLILESPKKRNADLEIIQVRVHG